MEYFLAVHSVEGAPAPSPEDMQTMFNQVDRVNAELKTAGAWVFAGGLLPPETATVVRVDGGMTDGPFAETKEQLGGVFVTDLPDLDEAIRLAALVPAADYGTLEIRPLTIR